MHSVRKWFFSPKTFFGWEILTENQLIMSQKYNQFSQKIRFFQNEISIKTWPDWEKWMSFLDSVVQNGPNSVEKT